MPIPRCELMNFTIVEHAANENTHKPCVHTRHDMKACSQWRTQAASYTGTRQNITWKSTGADKKHVAEHEPRVTQNTTQLTWRSARLEWTQDRTLTQQDRTWSMSVLTPTRSQNRGLNKAWVPGSEHPAPTWNKETRSCMLTRKQRYDGSVRDL